MACGPVLLLSVLRIALISPSPLVLAGLQAGLREFEVVLSSPTLADARSASFGHADVVIVDSSDEPDEVSGDGPPMVLLMPDEHAGAAEYLSDGISVLPIGAPAEMISVAVHAAASGLVAASPALMSSALRFAPAAERAAPAPELEPLTPREREVLEHLALGLGNREIAGALHISTHTAKFHVAQIIAKLAAKSRAHAVAKAMHAGIV